ncbi:TonB-dependent receptor [Spirosoma endophyticum]|uniref:Iron complex outermembrane recepter protein n=1 Tax=Spirosoma endophyticum TaxID=662367 RepID=A0A1I1YHK4_9BACT|nr:TonB-dependent receptor [Spirosoma endophyticum]SFE19001.1 iron complex outermembrane recepter protein [Spirosoma endophyticum]
MDNQYILNRFLLSGALWLLTLTAVFSQGVRGRITDAVTKAGIPGATIAVTNAKAGTTADSNGDYTLNLAPGSYTLRVTFVGYTNQTVNVTISGNENTTVDVALTESTASLSEVVVTGTRSAGRVKTESPVPVDIISVQQLTTQAPQNNLNQIMNMVAPSFTSNTTTVADGTDHIDPAQLRGLGPDQVLVLLNGKRRHTSSLVNVNGTPGRGSVGTDLNAIPAYAIDRIEVLRDGASAQYGSDAIAGIINVKMKEATGKLALSVYGGGNFSQGSNNFKGGMDGGNVQVDANYGVRIGKAGFINLTGSAQMRNSTSRAMPNTASLINRYNAIEYRTLQAGGNVNTLPTDLAAIKRGALGVSYFDPATQASIAGATTLTGLQSILATDVTDNELAARGLQRSDFSMRVGQSNLQSIQFFANSAIPINENHEFYAFGGYGRRTGDAAGFFRTPNQARAYTGIFINGFLPEIHSEIIDGSFAAGFRGKLGSFNYDLSNTFGSNSFNYGVENTVNATLLDKSPTVFKAGGLNFKQNTINLDLSRKFDVLAGLNFAFGAEGRFESYRIKAGDENSWARYDVNGRVITTATQVAPSDFFGNARPGGSQVFPGFRPENEAATKDANRQSMAVYADGELDVTDKWLLEGAIRFENYSDFGSTTNFKLATRYKLTNNINIRGAASTGFRAPSLAQIYFNSTSTQFVGGVPFEVGTFSNTSRPAELLGIPKLKQEESRSVSAGFTAKIPSANLTITADGYFVRINDRVVLTDQFARPSGTVTGSALVLQQLFDQANATAATFFTNAIDTQSKGIDLVISHRATLGQGVSLKSDLAGTVSQTKQIGDIKASKILVDNGQINNYYSEANRIYLEQAVPRVKFNLSHTLSMNKFDFFLRNVYFGKVTDPNTVDVNGDGIIGAIVVNGRAVENEHPTWGGRVITDLSVGYQITPILKLVVGANNIFDIYPDKNYGPVTAKRPTGVEANGTIIYGSAASTVDLSNSNQFVYSRNTSQFGQNGRFLFGRLNFTF